MNGMPISSISPDSWMEDKSVRSSIFMKIASRLVDTNVDLHTDFCDSSDISTEAQFTKESCTVQSYTKEVLSLGLLFLNFKDAITKHTNYAKEALTLLTQCFVTLPPNLAKQIKWSHFINVQGLPGRNISCDLHMEHLNRVVKTAIYGLGANKTEQAITRIGRCVGKIVTVLGIFDRLAGVSEVSGSHSKRSFLKDLSKIVDQLKDVNVFSTSHSHRSFSKMGPNLMKTLSLQYLKKWIIENFPRQY